MPDLVIVNVFFHLPIAHVIALTHSQDAELAWLAARRQWREVCVASLGRAAERFSHRVSPQWFLNVIKHDTPPPHIIHRLEYDLLPFDDALFMTPEWRQYLSKYTKTLDLRVATGERVATWNSTVPHLVTLNVVRLHLFIHARYAEIRSIFSVIGQHSALCWLKVHVSGCHGSVFSCLVVPKGVRHLEVTAGNHNPVTLPVLPSRLKSLTMLSPAGYDMSEHLLELPPRLEKLTMNLYYRPVFVHRKTLESHPGLQHNMVVYDGEHTPQIRGLLFSKRHFYLNLTQGESYSGMELPAGAVLKIFDTDDKKPRTAKVANPLFRSVRKVILKLPLDLAGVVIPPLVDVEVINQGYSVPAELWCIPGVILFDWSVDPQLVPRMERFRRLRTLQLKLNNALFVEQFPPLDSVKELELMLWGVGTCPDLSMLRLVRQFTLKVEQTEYEFVPQLYPPDVVTLELKWAAISKQGHVRERVSLCHLAKLELVSFERVRGMWLGLYTFPESLRRLYCLSCNEFALDGVKFPQRLRVLHIRGCGVRDPWATGSWWLPPVLRTPVAYPDSLYELDLGENYEVHAPPDGFHFPSELNTLALNNCGITDISKFCVPSSIQVLLISCNNIDIREDYAWPQLKRLTFCRVDNAGHVQRISEEERSLLERMIPGVELHEYYSR